MKAAIWVQHLLGTGHTVRASALARAMNDEGIDTTLILGATPPDTLDLSGIRTVTLAPVFTIEQDFKNLGGPDGGYSSLADERRQAILEAVDGADAFITEGFPFGRKPFAAELREPLAKVRAGGGITISSVRDILVRKDVPRRAFMAKVARETMDHIIVHGDETLTGPRDTFHMDPAEIPPVHYTGYIHNVVVSGSAEPHGKIVVTAGGGGFGSGLFEAALGAAALWPEGPPWHLLIPKPLADSIAGWQRMAPANVTVEPNRRDFQSFLGGASLCISQAGYNTFLDAIAAGPPMVLIPFADGDETEQSDRAALYSQFQGISVIDPEILTPEKLLAASKAALAGPRPNIKIRADGAARAARHIKTLAGG